MWCYCVWGPIKQDTMRYNIVIMNNRLLNTVIIQKVQCESVMLIM